MHPATIVLLVWVAGMPVALVASYFIKRYDIWGLDFIVETLGEVCWVMLLWPIYTVVVGVMIAADKINDAPEFKLMQRARQWWANVGKKP